MSWDDPLDFKEEGIVLDYKTAGVDIDAGNKFVEKLREKAPGIGGFGGMIKIPSGYDEPILVSVLMVLVRNLIFVWLLMTTQP